ncbi:jg26764 [Pararge aegeria aegeria]|uniref:adenylate cyclase n=1 Tax=Pararge aegeria aegeria TaxID=348720 RepID=A0A8S4QRN8_9NEOP|nr:jg26764 [Pararge aegeria aegeria]
MASACADSSKQTRFHEMHVQRHNNVSILYADIVNFTPLSERLSASDLVKTLNELFGRFDQIAQVFVSELVRGSTFAMLISALSRIVAMLCSGLKGVVAGVITDT